jgi:ApbE superfamily uncharacterized protein (UPF0280 family)
MQYHERTYRRRMKVKHLVSFEVCVRETDLMIFADRNLTHEALRSVHYFRTHIESYILQNPSFETSLVPLPFDSKAPPIVQEMLHAGMIANVGPMASVAGAIAEFIGHDLQTICSNVIVENGGDIYLNSGEDLKLGIFAGESPLSDRVAIRIPAARMPLGVCTSSATVGPSLNLGKADAVCIVSQNTALADAMATSVGNRVRCKDDIREALEYAISIPNIIGAIIIIGDTFGVKGDLPLSKA